MPLSVNTLRDLMIQDSPLAELSDHNLELIIAHASVEDYRPMDALVQEGDIGDSLFIVLQGQLDVSKLMGGASRHLALLSVGHCFGEISLISDAPRTATVTAVTRVKCLRLGQQAFDQLLESNGSFAKQITKLLSKRLLDTERATDRQLIESYETLIFALSDLAESRDPETGEHLLRVQNYCRELATLLMADSRFAPLITPEFINDIYVASPLHDIGKVGIPDDVLLKPGRLTEEEFEIMKQHAGLGAKTLERVLQKLETSTFRIAYQVILHHHERWDGSGYPSGLSGEDISLAGRIMALADVYDALLSKRVYKAAFSHEKAVDIIRSGAGSHFDPRITEVFLNNIERFQAIYQQYAEKQVEGELP